MMPIYSWACNKCKKVEDVTRTMAEYELPPDDACECGSMERTRVIQQWSRYQSQLVFGGKVGWHDECYVGKRGIPNGR